MPAIAGRSSIMMCPSGIGIEWSLNRSNNLRVWSEVFNCAFVGCPSWCSSGASISSASLGRCDARCWSNPAALTQTTSCNYSTSCQCCPLVKLATDQSRHPLCVAVDETPPRASVSSHDLTPNHAPWSSRIASRFVDLQPAALRSSVRSVFCGAMTSEFALRSICRDRNKATSGEGAASQQLLNQWAIGLPALALFHDYTVETKTERHLCRSCLILALQLCERRAIF